jgi:hypothetical protein
MDVVAGSDQIHVALVVILERGTVTVMGPAVSFDDDLLRRPEEVDEMPLHEDVDRWGHRILFSPKDQEVDL